MAYRECPRQYILYISHLIYTCAYTCAVSFAVIIILSFAGFALFIVQYIQMKKITQRFKETKGNAYMKFERVARWTELYQYMVGLLIFFTILKLIKLLRFNKKVSLLASTLQHCGKRLAVFAVIFLIIFGSFVQFFHIILLNDMYEFNTLLKSFETCFAMMLGRFEAQEMTRSNVFSPFFFILFMVVNMFILLNMALSIVIESFTAVKNDADQQGNEHEIVEYIFTRFQNWTGEPLGRATEKFYCAFGMGIILSGKVHYKW